MELFVLRILERVIVVVIGGLSIYLGYRLFHAVKATGEGAAEIKLPGDMTVMVSRIAPGVFFALFGAVIVVASLAFPVRYSEEELEMVGGTSIRTKDISGIGTGPQSGSATPVNENLKPERPANEALELERLRVREHIAFFNQLPRMLDPALPEPQRRRVHEKVLATKLRLMKDVWGQDWSPFEDFRLWAEGGAKAGDSEAFHKAAQFFTYGQEKFP